MRSPRAPVADTRLLPIVNFDPYADLAIMRRKRADPVLFSHEVGLNSA